MAEYYGGWISIPIKFYNEEIKEIVTNYSSSIDIEEKVDKGLIQIFDYETRCGEFENLERYFKKNNIPFDRQSDAYYENDAKIRKFRPKSENTLEIDLETNSSSSFSPYIFTEDIKKYKNMGAELFKKTILELLLYTDPDLKGLEEYNKEEVIEVKKNINKEDLEKTYNELEIKQQQIEKKILILKEKQDKIIEKKLLIAQSLK